MAIASKQVNELLYQALETEVGGVQVYQAAVRCAVNEDLKKQWTEYLEQTQEHERVLREAFDALGLDQEADSPGRQVVRHIGQSLVMAISMAGRVAHPRRRHSSSRRNASFLRKPRTT